MTKVIATLSPSLHVRDGQVFASSKDIAKLFGKRHDNVMSDIANATAALTPEIAGVWFIPTIVEQKVGFGVRKNPAYEMTRDGFSLIAIGYTGKRATCDKRPHKCPLTYHLFGRIDGPAS